MTTPAEAIAKRGAVVGFFLNLRDALAAVAGPLPKGPLDIALQDFDRVNSAYQHFQEHCKSLADILTDADCQQAMIDLGVQTANASFEDILNQADNAFNAEKFNLYGAYLHAWVDDIDAGLAH